MPDPLGTPARSSFKRVQYQRQVTQGNLQDVLLEFPSVRTLYSAVQKAVHDGNLVQAGLVSGEGARGACRCCSR